MELDREPEMPSQLALNRHRSAMHRTSSVKQPASPQWIAAKKFQTLGWSLTTNI